MSLFALTHGTFAVVQFHALGDLNPLVSVLVGDGSYLAVSRFPFQPFGLVALAIILVMAATSHDFWLANLTPPVWKTLHMLVYVAYGLLVVHVAFGILQAESSPLYPVLLGVGIVTVGGLHLAAGRRGAALDRLPADEGSDFVAVCLIDDIREGRARIATVAGERVAVFRYEGKLSAVSNVCQHQNGPLGEGRIIDGCITCPWHGFQYRPDTGQAPDPFTDRIPTFDVRLEGTTVLVGTTPHPPGTPVAPAIIPEHLNARAIDATA
jgi:nitrite reductase/ring-hydroxylating ferredoxin subunit